MAGRENGRPPLRAAFASGYAALEKLLDDYDSEEAIGVAGTGSEEELILEPICGSSAAELNAPQSIDGDRRARCIPQRAHEFTSDMIEGVDGASAGVVRNQKGVAESSEI